MDDKQASRVAGWKFFSCLFTGFIIVALVNSLFMYKAFTTHTGEVTDNAYQRGLSYNKTLAVASAEENHGWTPVVTVNKSQTGIYDVELKITDRSGSIIRFDSIEGHIVRPVNARDDKKADFLRRADGSYNANLALPHAGLWEVRALLIVNDQQFHVVKRIVVP